ncbi:MAG: lipopolysaccharide biosynthesis protein [Azoarcus sp.]|nr:lipopolysaccharide biosynthesis protein [Azoarcus sp.]
MNNKVPIEIQTKANAWMATFWAYAQNWLGRSVTFLVFLILARLLSPEEFGAFAVALLFITLGEVFVEQIFAQVIVQRETLTQLHLSSAFWGAMGLGLILSVAVYLIAPWYAEVFKIKSIEPIIAALSPIFLLMGLSSIHPALLRRKLNYKVLAFRTMFANFISGMTAIAVAFNGFGVWTFVIQLFVFYILNFIVLWCNEPWRPNVVFSFVSLKELFRYSGYIAFTKFIDLVETRGVELIVARILGVTILGYYMLAMKLFQALNQLFAAPLWDSSISILARLQLQRERFLDTLKQKTKFTELYIAPLFLIVFATSDILIPLAFGEKWIAVIVPFQFLCLLGALRAGGFLLVVALQAIGDVSAVVKAGIVRVIVTFISVWLMLDKGLLGVVLSILLGQFLSILIIFFLFAKYMNLSNFLLFRSVYTALTIVEAILAIALLVFIQYII